MSDLVSSTTKTTTLKNYSRIKTLKPQTFWSYLPTNLRISLVPSTMEFALSSSKLS